VAAIDFYLVGGRATPLKNMKVSWDYYSQYVKKYPNVPNHQPVILSWRNPAKFQFYQQVM